MPFNPDPTELAEAISELSKNITIGCQADSMRVLRFQASEILANVSAMRDHVPLLNFTSGETSLRLLDRISRAMVEILAGNLRNDQRHIRMKDAQKHVAKLFRGLLEYPHWRAVVPANNEMAAMVLMMPRDHQALH